MIYALQIAFAIFLTAGLFLMFDIDLLKVERSNNFSFTQIAAKAKRSKLEVGTLNKFEILTLRVESLLKKINKTKQYLYAVMAACFVGGAVVGYICFGGTFLAFATGICFVPMAYLYLIFRTQEATRVELADLESTMSIITNSYLANNNILRSVELYVEEKNRYVDRSLTAPAPTPFEEFISDCLYINPNIEGGLVRLAAKINNKYFDQWIKNLRLCLKNKNMRFSLRPVIDAMTDEKIMQIEFDAQMAKVWRTYLGAVAVLFSVILVLRIANKEWYLILVDTTVGKALILVMLAAALISAVYVMKINKPIGTM